MTVLAISAEGREFLYNAASARAVSARSAGYIRDVVNQNRYLLKEGQVWCVHELCEYDAGYDYAQFQRFTVRKGVVSDVRC